MKHHIRFAILFTVVCAVGLVLAAEFEGNKRFFELKSEAEKTSTLKPNEVKELTQTYQEYTSIRNEEFSKMLVTLRLKDVALLTPRYNESLSRIIKATEARESEMVKLSEPAYKLFLSFKKSEFDVLEAMKLLKLAPARDRIVYLNAYLKDYTEKLEVKWKDLLSQDQNYDDQERRISDEIQEIFRQTALEIAESKKTVKERIKNVIEAVAKVGVGQVVGLTTKILELFLDFSKNVSEIEEKTIGKLLNSRQKVQERAATLRNYYNIEKRGILVLFSDTYYDTKKFINENGFDQAKLTYEEARKDAAELANKGTTGQREDGRIFADTVMSILGDQLGVMKDTFNNFVYKNEGIFFGPVGPKLTAELLEMRTWEEENAETQRIDLEGFLRRYSDETNEDFKPLFVNLSGLTDTDRSNIERKLRDILSGLQRELETTTKLLSNQNMQQLLLEERKELQKELESGKN